MTVCTRGSGSAAFDYADFMERFFGATTALILCDYFADPSYAPTVARMRARFGDRVLEATSNQSVPNRMWSPAETAAALTAHKVTHMHVQIGGSRWQNKVEFPRLIQSQKHNVSLAVHAMFHGGSRFGNAFAKLDDTVSGIFTPVVPYMTRPLSGASGSAASELLRGLGIPATGVSTICGYGGQTSFDIGFVRETVCSLGGGSGSSPSNLFFIFANFPTFCTSASRRVFFLPNMRTQEDKHAFVQACTAMLHARASGETFGLAVAEFNMMSRPVLTWNGSVSRAHINILGNQALLYSNADTLRARLLDLATADGQTLHVQPAYANYQPEPVMLRFCHVFYWQHNYTKAYEPRSYLDRRCAH